MFLFIAHALICN